MDSAHFQYIRRYSSPTVESQFTVAGCRWFRGAPPRSDPADGSRSFGPSWDEQIDQPVPWISRLYLTICGNSANNHC